MNWKNFHINFIQFCSNEKERIKASKYLLSSLKSYWIRLVQRVTVRGSFYISCRFHKSKDRYGPLSFPPVLAPIFVVVEELADWHHLLPREQGYRCLLYACGICCNRFSVPVLLGVPSTGLVPGFVPALESTPLSSSHRSPFLGRG